MNLRSKRFEPLVWLALWFGLILIQAPLSWALEPDLLPSEVGLREYGHGTRLTDAEGFTLYHYDGDLKEPGSSTCLDECAIQYPPLLVSSIPEQIPSHWTVISRDDGTQQWAYKDRPLYLYGRDGHAGAAFGEGGGWTVSFNQIRTPPELSIQNTVLGHVLASLDGLTLYFQQAEENAKASNCINECLETWLPLEAPWSAIKSGDFSVHARGDGISQWAFDDKPLYLHARDSAPGDVKGHQAENWTALVLEPAPPNPDWVMIVGSDGGKLFANSDGMTLYTLNVMKNNDPLQALGSNVCDAQCLADGWRPVEAQSMIAPIGKWSVIQTNNNGFQWAHLGLPLYTSKHETRRGELSGTTRREYQWLKPIMYELPALQGVFN